MRNSILLFRRGNWVGNNPAFEHQWNGIDESTLKMPHQASMSGLVHPLGKLGISFSPEKKCWSPFHIPNPTQWNTFNYHTHSSSIFLSFYQHPLCPFHYLYKSTKNKIMQYLCLDTFWLVEIKAYIATINLTLTQYDTSLNSQKSKEISLWQLNPRKFSKRKNKHKMQSWYSTICTKILSHNSILHHYDT